MRIVTGTIVNEIIDALADARCRGLNVRRIELTELEWLELFGETVDDRQRPYGARKDMPPRKSDKPTFFHGVPLVVV